MARIGARVPRRKCGTPTVSVSLAWILALSVWTGFLDSTVPAPPALARSAVEGSEMSMKTNPGVPHKADTLIPLRGEVVDARTRQPLPARVYIEDERGSWLYPDSASPTGSAVPYRKQARQNPRSVEMHSTLSAHPFVIELPPGRYTVIAERGKEYFPESRRVVLADSPVSVTIPLRRWIDMAERGWYSGDTHVHRTLEELPNVMLAEDLNVTFPLLHWVTKAFAPPASGPRSVGVLPEPKPIVVDQTHVIYPLNTEYEIGSVDGKRHVLGAFFVLGHRTLLQAGVPPLGRVARDARRGGALLELDKHAWPWSMALPPIMGVDLYELANNHVWRTEFGFPTFGEPAADYMEIERTERGWTEWGWIDYGLQNYYALLNCGFRLRPTAGTASGVHPVPLGFSRVYVKLDGRFSYEDWFRGLGEGRSFVTNGPMLFVTVNDCDPGHVFTQRDATRQVYRIAGSAVSSQPLARIEIVSEGEVVQQLQPGNRKTETGAYESVLEATFATDRSTWLAVRCFEDDPEKRVRFAHTGPFHIEVAGAPLQPRRVEVEYLMARVQREIDRSEDVLPPQAIEEYRQALREYRDIAATAR